METLREIIYDIKERCGIYSDDSNFADEHIAQMIISKRNLLLKQYISNLRKEVPYDALQEICMKLTEIKCEDDLKYLQTEERLPGVIETSGKNLVEEVYFDSISARWVNIIKYNRVPYLKGTRFAHKQIYVTITPDRKVMVIKLDNTHVFIEDIKLKILASDPEAADELSCSTREGEPCDFYDKPFPCESSLIDIIKTQVTNDLTIKYRLPVDKVNDAEDNTDNAGMQMYGRRPRVATQQEQPTETTDTE